MGHRPKAMKPTKQLPRARATPEQTYQRVERIVGMMRDGSWVRGASADLLAEEWGLASVTVRELAGEASRIVAREVTDPERVKIDVSTILMRDIERASVAADFGNVARIGDVVTRIVGARAPEKVEHTATYAAMRPPEMLQAVEAQIAKLQAVRSRILEGMNVVQALPAPDDDS